jgi:DNA-binding NtrC family response regulator
MKALFASWRATASGGDAASSALADLAAATGGARPRVDLIIADLRLANGASGIDAIVELRSHLKAEPPALIVSGDTSAAGRAEVEAAGIRLLIKPVVASALKDAAEGALHRRAERRVGEPH